MIFASRVDERAVLESLSDSCFVVGWYANATDVEFCRPRGLITITARVTRDLAVQALPSTGWEIDETITDFIATAFGETTPELIPEPALEPAPELTPPQNSEPPTDALS